MAVYNEPTKPDYVVHTGFYTAAMAPFFRQLMANLESGTHCGSRAGKKMQNATVFINPDGEVVFNLVKNSGSYYYSNRIWNRTIWAKCKMDGQKIREEIAWLIKIMVHAYLAKQYGQDQVHAHWTRTDDTMLDRLFNTPDITTADVYCIYEILRDRPNIDKKYSAEMIGKWRGEQRDPVFTEMEVARREQIETFKKEAVELENSLCRERDRKINEAENQIRVLYKEKIAAVQTELESKIKELDEQLNFMQAM